MRLKVGDKIKILEDHKDTLGFELFKDEMWEISGYDSLRGYDLNRLYPVTKLSRTICETRFLLPKLKYEILDKDEASFLSGEYLIIVVGDEIYSKVTEITNPKESLINSLKEAKGLIRKSSDSEPNWCYTNSRKVFGNLTDVLIPLVPDLGEDDEIGSITDIKIYKLDVKTL